MVILHSDKFGNRIMFQSWDCRISALAKCILLRPLEVDINNTRVGVICRGVNSFLFAEKRVSLIFLKPVRGSFTFDTGIDFDGDLLNSVYVPNDRLPPPSLYTNIHLPKLI